LNELDGKGEIHPVTDLEGQEWE